MHEYIYIKNVVFLQQGRQSKNAWALPNDTSNKMKVRYVKSQEDNIRGIEAYADFSKKVLAALEVIRTENRNLAVRVARIEIDMKNNQHTKLNQRCLELVRNTLDKI